LGHYEIICPLHLLLGMLVNARPLSLTITQPDWDRVLAAMQEFAPPWEDGLVVLSPGGQTPTAKRVLARAAELAQNDGEAVEVEHIWAAMCAAETELVQAVLSRLDLSPGVYYAKPGAAPDRGGS
jgi:hypothetical protein